MELISYSENPEIFREVLETFVDKFEKLNIDYYIYSGVVLGWIREGDIIPWEQDINFGIKSPDADKLRLILDWVPEVDAYIHKYGRNYIRCVLHGIQVDCLIHYKKGGYYIYDAMNPVYGYVYTGVIPAKYVDNPTTFKFHGKEYKIPCKTEEYLGWQYGPDWILPRAKEPYNQKIYGRNISSAIRRKRMQQ